MVTKFWAISLLVLMSTALCADEKSVRVSKTEDAGSELQLEARQMPLASILDKIAKVTGVPIHYSMLPKGLVTACCAGATVKPILECLLNKKADLIFRYPRKSSKADQQNCPAEVWVMGAHFDVEPKASAAVVSAERPPIAKPVRAIQTLSKEDADKLTEMVTDKNPQYRAVAVSNLAARQANDPATYKILESALSDQNAEVRAQAVAGLSKQKGYDVSTVLQSALQDDNVSVRLMAVDNAGDNPVLLQQALNDSDETVRTYAAIKLETLSVQ